MQNSISNYDQESEEDEDSIASFLAELRDKMEIDRQQRMDRLQAKISAMRDESVRARKASGIETIWAEDTEYYEGIDDFNRSTTTYSKPYFDGPLQRSSQESTSQCTAFFNITRQFVDSAAARCGDILLPAGDWNWGVKKTPIADDIGSQDESTFDQAQQDINAEKVKKGERRIKDWLVDARYHREYRRAIEFAAKTGTGIIKGPYPLLKISTAVINGEVVTKQEIIPAVKAINPVNFFPDLNCGDDIHKGDYQFERDYLTYKQLSDLGKDPSYFADAIQKVLKEGPKGSYKEEQKSAKETDLFEVWYGIANIDMNDMDLIDDRFKKELSFEVCEDGSIELSEGNCEYRDKDYQSIVVVLVNSTIIQGHMNPLQSGKYPYRVLCWQRRDDSPFGIGIARQGRVAQQMLLSSARNLIDNMALSSMPMLALRREGVEPENGKWELTKGKVWWLTSENIRSIQEAIQFLQLPSLQKELMEIMMLAGKMFEDATGVNSLLQGQQGSAPDTVGGMELLHKNASALLRRIARTSDEEVTEPLILDYYDWLLMYGSDEEKGDFSIEAFGSSILVEREIEQMQAQTLLQYSQDPSYGLSKSKIMAKIVDSWGFESSSVMMDEKEKQALSEQGQQQQPDPRVQVAQMNVEKDLQIAETRAQVELARIKKDQDRDAIFSQGVTERNQINYQAQIAKLQLERELAMLQYANENRMTLDKIKADLASDSMKLSVQKELASMNNAMPAKQMLTPPSEPPQRADPGMAFQQ